MRLAAGMRQVAWAALKHHTTMQEACKPDASLSKHSVDHIRVINSIDG
jgi:hypothetical protein